MTDDVSYRDYIDHWQLDEASSCRNKAKRGLPWMIKIVMKYAHVLYLFGFVLIILSYVFTYLSDRHIIWSDIELSLRIQIIMTLRNLAPERCKYI